MTESQPRAQQVAFFPFGPLHYVQCHNAVRWVVPSYQIPKALPLITHNRHAKTKKKAQMKEQIKAPEKIQLSNEEISDAEFKTLVIKMLTEMVEYGYKVEEKVKAMKSEIKENVQGTNSEGKETGTQINNLEQKEK